MLPNEFRPSVSLALSVCALASVAAAAGDCEPRLRSVEAERIVDVPGDCTPLKSVLTEAACTSVASGAYLEVGNDGGATQTGDRVTAP